MVGFAATETFDFKFETMGKDGWASNYAEHTVEGTIANVVFASANKQANTITDVPVTKGGNVTATLKNINSYKITGVKFVCKQWGSKAQTITLNVSGDGEAFTATQTTSDNFTLEATGLDTKAVRFTFSSTSNQVGISSLEITYETVPQGGDQPGLKKPTILINEEAPAASYSTEDLPLTLSITSGNGVTSAPVFVYNLTGSLDYNSSVSAWFSLGLVQENPGCPYPLVVGQNTIHVWEIVNGERSPEATVTITLTEPVGNLTALKQVWALTDGDEFTFGAKTAVLGKDKNSRNLYIVDLDNAGGLMIDGGANNTWGDDYVFGKAIGSGWSGKKATFRNQPEATNTQDFAIDGTAEVQPLSIEAADVNAENYGRYAVIENATVAAGGTIEGYTLYNQLGIDMASVEAGLYNVYGIIGLYSQNLQFWPMRYEPIEDPTFVAAPTITVTPQFGVGADEAIWISCATEGATIYYSVEKGNEIYVQWTEYQNEIDLSQYTAGEYNVKAKAEKDGVESEVANATFTITEPVGNLTALKKVWDLTDGDEFTFGAKTAVLGKDKNSRNLYIVDLDNAGGLMIDGGANNTWGDDYVFGKAIGSGWSGKKATYRNQPEATNTQNFDIDGTAEVQPLSIEAKDVTADNYGRYAVIENATVAAGGAIEGYTLYNQLGIDMTSVEAGLYNVYGIIGLYSQNLQFWPMRYEPIEDPTFVAAPTITVTPQFGVGANEAIFIDCATEGATIYYGIEKDGETLIEIEEYAGPIDLSQYEAGEYTVEAYAVNGDYESEVASATFTITEPAEAVEYKLVTSTDDLQGGDYVIFASGRHAAGLGASGDGINNGFTFDGDKVEVETEDILVLSIVPANTEGEFAIMHGEKYMNLGSGAAPTFVNDPHAWPIEIDEDGNATIHGTTSNPNTPRALIYRSDSDIFKNYALSNVENGNGYELVQIFKKVEQQEEGLTLAEVLALEEPADVNIISKLTVVAHNADYTFATDTEGNWIRLDLEEILDETQVINNVKGAYNANPLSPALAVEDFSLLEEQDDNNYIVNIDLKEQFDIPVPAQVVKVTGYYQKGGTLRGWAELLGQSLILSNDLTGFAGEPFDDMVDTEGTTVIVGALYENVPVAIEYFEPMSDEMLAPRRAAEYKFQNLNGQMIDDALPVPSEVPTAIETVESTKGVKSVKYVNAMGQMSDRAFDGMNIVVTTYNDGTTSTVKVVK